MTCFYLYLVHVQQFYYSRKYQFTINLIYMSNQSVHQLNPTVHLIKLSLTLLLYHITIRRLFHFIIPSEKYKIPKYYCYRYQNQSNIVMGCVVPKQTKSQPSQVECQAFDERVFNNNQKSCLQTGKMENTTNQNSQMHIFDFAQQSCSIEIPKKINDLNKRNSLTLTQQSKQLKSQRKTSKNKSKQQQNIPTNNDCSNPQKYSHLKQNKIFNPFVKYEDQKQLKIDNSSIIKRKSNLVESKRSQSLPKSSNISPQKNQQKNKPKKVTIQCQQNTQLSIPSSSYLENHDGGSPRRRKSGIREPRGKSCNLFKTFEGDYIEDQDDKCDYFRGITFKSMDGIADKIHRK